VLITTSGGGWRNEKKLAENPLDDEKTGGSMAVSGGCFYIRSETNLYCIGKQN